jgi:hypothetical protein
MSFLKTFLASGFAVAITAAALHWTYSTDPQVVDPHTGEVLGPAHSCPELNPLQPKCGVGQWSVWL